MLRKVFSKKDLALFKSIVGSQFISYECGIGEIQFSRAYGNMRLNFSDRSIELQNIETPTTYRDVTDDISGFSCRTCSINEEFKPYIEEETVVTEISEMVTGVEVVEDTISINNSCKICFSSAVIIRTQINSYMFCRTYQYNENIFFNKSEDYDAIYPIHKVIEDWNNEGEYQVSVERNKRIISNQN